MPPLTRSTSFTKRRSLKPKLKRKGSEFVDSSDDEGAPSSNESSKFVKPLPRKRTASQIGEISKETESLLQGTVLSFNLPPSKKRKANGANATNMNFNKPPLNDDKMTEPVAPILKFNEPPPKANASLEDEMPAAPIINFNDPSLTHLQADDFILNIKLVLV
eukprot:TRINITY_DN4048_c0_g1_i1.p1 TRINITY_DN4048_c0_g1~~TRINITY_DN4048_c0_g1_i1.p1  ORF type:complete len:186 (+),score=41.96 TRINITY_DN4048_c0_g1_i1:75-560(+)